MQATQNGSNRFENRTLESNRMLKQMAKEPLAKWVMTKGSPRHKQNSTEDDFRAAIPETTHNWTAWGLPYPSQPGFGAKSDQSSILDFGANADHANFPFLNVMATETTVNDTFGTTDPSLTFSPGPLDANHTTATFNASLQPTGQTAPGGMTAYDILRWVHIPAYAIILCLAVAGNALVIGTLAPRLLPRMPSRLTWKATRAPEGGGAADGGSWRVRSLTNVFLLNLAVADLLLGLLCVPFTLVGAILRDFVFGGAMCKLIPYLQGE